MKKIVLSLMASVILTVNISANECIKNESRIGLGVIGVLQGVILGGPIGAFWGIGAIAFADAYKKDCIQVEDKKVEEVLPSKENVIVKENIDNKLDGVQNNNSNNADDKNFKQLESFVNFEFNSYAIKNINVNIDSLNPTTIKSIIIEGNTDSKGTDEYNFALGLKRANAVKSFLIENNMPVGNLSVVSYGETAPLSKNDAENRRVDLKLFYK